MSGQTIKPTDSEAFIDVINAVMPVILRTPAEPRLPKELINTIRASVLHHDEQSREDLAYRAVLFAHLLIHHEIEIINAKLLNPRETQLVIEPSLIWSVCNIPLSLDGGGEAVELKYALETVVETARHFELLEGLEEHVQPTVH